MWKYWPFYHHAEELHVHVGVLTTCDNLQKAIFSQMPNFLFNIIFNLNLFSFFLFLYVIYQNICSTITFFLIVLYE
jgi:hypothetical protein